MKKAKRTSKPRPSKKTKKPGRKPASAFAKASAKVAKKQREAIRRKKISEALKAYHATGKTKEQRQRKERRETKKKLPRIPRGVKDNRKPIEAMLSEAGKITAAEHGLDHDVRGVTNKDGSAAYELRFAIPKGKSSQDDITSTLITLSNALRPMVNSWISIGFRFSPDSRIKEEDYDRYRGLMQVQAHSQRNTARKIFANMQGADFVQRHMKANRRKRPEQIFVHVHWNPKGTRPE